jgi:integrase
LVVHLFISGGYRKVPIVLSPEAARLLEQAPGLKYKAALGTVYGAGLRVSEVLALKVSDPFSVMRRKNCNSRHG